MEQKEYLSIKSFGPIKDVKLDNIKPFTFFIGESGSGKVPFKGAGYDETYV